MVGLRGATRGIAFIKILILARILSPNEFGLFGIAMLFLSLLEIISETGVNIFLIQEGDEIDTFVDTAWIVSIVRGILIALVLFLLSPVISHFFNSPQSLNVMYAISIVPLIRGFVNPSVIKFQKELHFKKEFIYRFLIFAIDGAFAITFALLTHSAVSLVYGLIAGAVFEVIVSYLISRPRPRFNFDSEKFKLVVSRGKWVTAAGFFNYLFENIDDGAVARIMDTASLGIYQMAYKISSLPMTEVSDVIQKVTFPVYSKISEDKQRLKMAFLKSFWGTLVLVLPFSVVLLLFPGPLVKIILGEKWLGAVGVIKILAFFGIIRALTETTYPLFLSLKKQKYVSLITLISIMGLVITIIPLVKSYGIVGAGASGLVGSILAIPIVIYLILKVFK